MSINRVFILGKIKDIKGIQTEKNLMKYLIIETQDSGKDQFANQKSTVIQHYVVLPKTFNEYLANLEPDQRIMVQGCLKNKQQNQYTQLKCTSYIYAERIQNIEALIDVKEMEVNDGLPFPKHFKSLWSESQTSH